MARTLDDIARGNFFFDPGTWPAKVVSVEPAQSANGRDAQIKFEIQFLDGQYAGRHATYWRTLNQKSEWVIGRDLKGAGLIGTSAIPDEGDYDVNSWMPVVRQLNGGMYLYEVTQREYTARDGKTAKANDFTIVGPYSFQSAGASGAPPSTGGSAYDSV